MNARQQGSAHNTPSLRPGGGSFYHLILGLLTCIFVASACRSLPKHTLPGQSEFNVRQLTFRGAEQVSPSGIESKLAVRPGNIVIPAGPYNPYRLAEDRRRLSAYWHSMGYLDVQVEAPVLDVDETAKEVSVIWTLDEGPRYRISEIRLEGPPQGTRSALMDLIPFKAGAPATIEHYRVVRHQLADHLRRAGWAHAEVYSRSYLRRHNHTVVWVYFVDSGPPTRVGKVTVTGNRKISQQQILERVGLAPNAPYNLGVREQAELDLLDTGAFHSVHIESNADNEFIIDNLPPDTGGVLKPEQVDTRGDLVPRPLAPAIDLNVVVTEAPNVQGRVGIGGSMSAERLDGLTGASLTLRNLFGPLHHLVMDGRVGYGWLWRGDTDEPLGLHGQGELRWLGPGLLGRVGDMRFVAAMTERLRPGYHLRQVLTGPGVQSTLMPKLHLEADLLFSYERVVGMGTVSIDSRRALGLSDPQHPSYGAELRLNLVWDTRDNRVEALRGHLIALRGRWAPGQPMGTHRGLRLDGEARLFVPLAPAFSLGVRLAGAWLLADGPEGTPPGLRLSGGGAFGMRGFGQDRLAPHVEACQGTRCRALPVGARSLVETALELRWLPFRFPVGAILFADLGGAGSHENPFDTPPEIALGLGLRVRTWHLPVSLDLAWRATNTTPYRELDRWQFFLRVGEGF